MIQVKSKLPLIICLIVFQGGCEKSKGPSPSPENSPWPVERPEPTELEGDWIMLESTDRGEKQSPESLKTIEVSINGGTIFMRDEGRDLRYGFTLDPKSKPKTIDITHPKGTDFGIYALDRNKLKIYMNVEQGARPTAFPSAPDKSHSLMVLQRVNEPGR